MRGNQRSGLSLLFLLLWTGSAAYAQFRTKIERYTTEDGLSHDGVMSMIKDHEGYMWFGTWDGINRFDGRSFVTYKSKPGDKLTLKSNRTDILTEDPSGFLWLRAYDRQIYRFDKKKEVFLGISEPLIKNRPPDLLVIAIIPAKKEGFVWLITPKQGVFCVRKSNTVHPDVVSYGAGKSAEFKIPSDEINFLREDDLHHIWVGTKGGLVCLTEDSSGTFKPDAVQTGLLASFSVTSMAESRDRIWFGTDKGYLLSYDKAAKRFTERKVTDHRINGVQVSKRSNRIFASTAQGELISVSAADATPVVLQMNGAGAFYSIYEDKAGYLWIEPENDGTVRLDLSRRKFSYFRQERDAAISNSPQGYLVFEDVKGNVWVNMKGGGFGYYDPKKNEVAYFYNRPGSKEQLFSNLVTCQYYDPAGILWLTGIDRGINKIIFQDNNFTADLLVSNPRSKADNSIRGVYSDQEGRLWLTSKSGEISVTRNGKRIGNLFTNLPPAGIGLVYDILEDSKSNIWLGTKFNGLFKAVPVNKERSKYWLTRYAPDDKDPYSLKSPMIYSVIEDRKGRIWVGSFDNGIYLLVQKGGATRFLNIQNTFKHYPKGPYTKIRNLACDERGNIWLGTTNGLLVLKPTQQAPENWRFNTYVKVPGDVHSLGNNDIQHIYHDSKNRVWIATSGGGLNEAIRTAGGNLKFRVYTRDDGLPSDYIVSMVEDDRGDLWIASENGLSKFTPGSKQFRNFNSYDGIPMSGFSETSSLKLTDGRILFGGNDGYLVFNPADIVDRKIRANMAFTALQINNKEVSPGAGPALIDRVINDVDKLTVHYNENIISIDFTVLDYRSEKKQVYAYKLKGFDKEWHDVKNQHKATYTNLPPGNYIFEVKSLSDDLYSNRPSKELPITILPPPWRTGWAYLAYFILAGILTAAALRIARTMIRLRNKIAVEQKLTELKLSFFTNISHELRTPLTLIVNPITEIGQRETLSPKGREYIQVVLRNANRMVRFINQLLDLRKIQSGKMALKVTRVELLAFVKEIGAYFTELAREKQIDLRIGAGETPVFAWIDAEKMDIVIYNLLANAFKFTPAGRVIQVSVSQDREGNPEVSVRDEGTGVPDDKLEDIFELYYEGVTQPGGDALKGTGIGLALSKELVRAHHGSIEAKNNPAGGLKVIVRLIAGKAHFNKNEIMTGGDSDQPLHSSDVGASILPATAVGEKEKLPLVLLVEDNTDLRRFLSSQLSEIYRIAEAENGREGFEKAKALLPDLVLSDVMMPEMDGIKMLDALKNDILTSHIPVIILSAKFSIESQIEGLKYGADYYIAKPFSTDFLLASIANLLKQRKQLFDSLLDGKKKIDLLPGEVIITSKDEDFLKHVIRIVGEGMADPAFNIELVAESAGMGRTAFYKKFKSLTNLAPVEFVRQMRLKRGKQLLDAGETNISEIAYSVGFSSGGYFSTCFKEAYGTSPKEYLKTERG